MLWSRIAALPEDSAFVRSITKGHTSHHELLAQIRDAVTTQAHGYRWEGKPSMYERPAMRKAERSDAADPTNPHHAAEIKRFFGTPR